MIDVLLEKIKSWTPEKMLAYTNNFPLPDLPERNQYIQEKILNGLVIYSNKSLRYIGDDGVVVAITESNDSTCYDVLCKLYNSSFRTIKPVKRQCIDGFEIVELKNEFDDPGIPGYAEIQENNLNTEYILEFVRQVGLMIDQLDILNCKYPGIVNPYKFVRDEKGFFFNPYIGNVDVIRFINSKEDFLELQNKQLGYLLFAFKESSNIDFDVKLIKSKAKELWRQ